MAYDKVIDSSKLDSDLTSVADAIRSKGGTSEALAFPAGFVSAIEAIEAGGGGGGGEVTPPTTPTDGKTRVYIHLEYGRTSPMLGVCPKGTVTVDWGDGTEPDTLTGTSTTTVKWTPTHEYTAPGDYVIALTVEGTMGFYGNGSTNQYSGILRYASGADTRNRAYQNAVQKVDIGEGVTSISDSAFQSCSSLASITIPESVASIGNGALSDCSSLASITIPESVTFIGSYAFSNCSSLASITIPEGVTSIGNYAFNNCPSLASITIPESVTFIGNGAFQSCPSLASITIPEGVTSIGRSAFINCSSLASITIPESVTSIGEYAFQNCYGMRYYDFTASASVPALSSTNAFNGIPSDCQMLIPAALYDEWSAATNWATYASYMVLWMVSGGDKVILEVEKITSDTYAGETTYTGEQFILLDIYPKTNGTVKVTYGGLTKTITDTSGAEEPNAQEVFFGTFNGVSDEVETPTSGTLKISGDCAGFGCGSYAQDNSYKKDLTCCCITAVEDVGEVVNIPESAFHVKSYSSNGGALKKVILKEGVLTIGEKAFVKCTGLEQMTIPATVKSIPANTWSDLIMSYSGNGNFLSIDEKNPYYSFVGSCLIEKSTNKLLFGFSDAVIPQGIKVIGEKAFYSNTAIKETDIVIPDGVTTIYGEAFAQSEGWTTITVPNTVTQIYPGAFFSTLVKNSTLKMLATTPPEIVGFTSSSTFVFYVGSGVGNSIVVPKGCGATYKSTNGWRPLANYIVEAS